MDRHRSRRRFLRTIATGSAVGLAGCSTSPPSETVTSPASGEPSTSTADQSAPEAVALERVASGFQAPVAVAFLPDRDLQYVADQSGLLHAVESGSLRDEPVLDLRDAIEVGGEKGLLGLALHPEFDQNRRLFVRYSAPRRSNTPSDYSHTFVLAEFEASEDGRRVRRDSERTLLEIPEPQANHNSGAIAFGPEGFLYVGVGDGGAGGDRGPGHVAGWYDAVGGGNGQDVAENLLGSLLRIDVDGRDGGRPYAVPGDNPLVGRDGLDEHYAWGFRNPWRFSFDGSDLLVGDVGQGSYEEVDLVRKGGNYGWNVREGTHCFRTSTCPDRTPATVRDGEPLLDPVVEYPHGDQPVGGVSVIGGYVYRGSALSGLDGRYVFGDLAVDGRLFVARPTGDDRRWPSRALPLVDADRRRLKRLLSFGRDRAGELYALGTGADGGAVFRIVAAD